MASIFDIFSTGPAQDAANAQILGINQGLTTATGNINDAIAALRAGYGGGGDALTRGFNNAGTSLTTNFGNAADALKTNYTAGLQPFLQNFQTGTAGVQQLENVLGFGPGGQQGALDTLRATPGYQFALQSGNDAINAANAASGKLASGNQILDLAKFNQGLSDQTYNNYVSQLQPFLGMANTAASGIGGLYSGLGSGLAGISTGLGSGLAGLQSGLGQALNANSIGLGGATANQADTLAGLNWNAFTGVGNARANADLADYNASKNMWGALGNIGSLAGSIFGGLGGPSMGAPAPTGSFSPFQSGGVFGGPGSWSFGGGSSGGGGGGGFNIGSLAPFLSMLSDERLKEDVEKVGELYDGQNVYSYRYKGDPIPRIGLMAQEVERKYPDAVTEIGGFKAVDYNKATDMAASLARFLEAA